MLSHGISTYTPTIEELTTDYKNTLTQGTETSHRHTLNADSYTLPSTDHYRTESTPTDGCSLIVQAASYTDHYTPPSTPTTEQGTHHRGMLSHGIGTDTPTID